MLTHTQNLDLELSFNILISFFKTKLSYDIWFTNVKRLTLESIITLIKVGCGILILYSSFFCMTWRFFKSQMFVRGCWSRDKCCILSPIVVILWDKLPSHFDVFNCYALMSYMLYFCCIFWWTLLLYFEAGCCCICFSQNWCSINVFVPEHCMEIIVIFFWKNCVILPQFNRG